MDGNVTIVVMIREQKSFHIFAAVSTWPYIQKHNYAKEFQSIISGGELLEGWRKWWVNGAWSSLSLLTSHRLIGCY